MKKSLILLAMLAASPVFAQQSAITVYGVLDASIANQKNGNPGAATRLDSSNQSGSRVGFKGTEDLGGGLKANFVLEAGYAIDDGNSAQGALFGRQASIGLSNSWGAVHLGRQKAPMYDVMDKLDPFKIGLTGDANRLFKTTARVNNALTYFTPQLNGFSGNFLYAPGEAPGNARANRTQAMALEYDTGPLETAFAYHKTYDASGNDSARKTLLGANYKFPAFKLHSSLQINKGVGSLNTRLWLIGASAPLTGRMRLLVGYTRVSDRAVSQADANQTAIGTTYELSKRTNLYSSYARTTNEANGKSNVAIAGATDKFFNVGLRHKF
jgi:predicted porin